MSDTTDLVTATNLFLEPFSIFGIGVRLADEKDDPQMEMF
jgi:hypothetical protein